MQYQSVLIIVCSICERCIGQGCMCIKVPPSAQSKQQANIQRAELRKRRRAEVARAANEQASLPTDDAVSHGCGAAGDDPSIGGGLGDDAQDRAFLDSADEGGTAFDFALSIADSANAAADHLSLLSSPPQSTEDTFGHAATTFESLDSW